MREKVSIYFSSPKIFLRAEILTAKTASSTKEDVAKQTRKLLKKGLSADAIKKELNKGEAVNVMIKQEVVEEGTENFPKNVTFKTGVSDVYKDGEFFFVNKVVNVMPAAPKTIDESRGRAINDYQQFLEDNWVVELKKEFKVEINKEVFERLKATLTKNN